MLAAVLAGCQGQPAPGRIHPAPAAVPAAPAPGSAPAPAAVAEIAAVPPHEGWELARLSWVAADRDGLLYLLHRGDRADPVVVIDREGRVVRSWGRGMYGIAHSIRVDSAGNVWTTDAKTSVVTKFAPDGTRLMTIAVGGQPEACTQQPHGFCGTTDVAFGADGRLFVADGYANARIVEYTADGRRVREWGERGSGPGQFNLPHSIVVGEDGTMFVADRENGRVQRFDLEGRFLGAWPTDGNPYSLALVQGGIWMGVLRRPASDDRQPMLVLADRLSGGTIRQVSTAGGHGIGTSPGGEHLLVPVRSTVHLLDARVDRASQAVAAPR